MADNERVDLYRLAFSEARRRVDTEIETLENMRARAGTLFSAAAVVGALVVRPAIESPDPSLTIAGWVSIVAAAVMFVTIAVATIVMWWGVPTRDRNSAMVLIADYIEADVPADLEETYRNLAMHGDLRADELEEAVSGRRKWFAAALMCFGVMVIVLPLVAWDAVA